MLHPQLLTITPVLVPAFGLERLSTDGQGPLVVGSVSVSSEIPLSGVILFGGTAGVAGVGTSSRLENAFAAPVETRFLENVRTGVAVMNLEQEPASLTLQLSGVDGAVLADTQITLEPNGHQARFVDELEWDPAVDFSNFRGLVKVSSAGELAATVLQTRPGQFATMPVLELQ